MTDPLVVLAVVFLVALVLLPVVLIRPRKQPPPPPPVDLVEANYAKAYGYTPAQWAALTPNQRRDLRNHVAHAPYRKDAA